MSLEQPRLHDIARSDDDQRRDAVHVIDAQCGGGRDTGENNDGTGHRPRMMSAPETIARIAITVVSPEKLKFTT